MHGKIAYAYACTKSVYVMIEFMNTHNKNITQNVFLSSLIIYCYKMLHDFFQVKQRIVVFYRYANSFSFIGINSKVKFLRPRYHKRNQSGYWLENI